MSNTIRIYDNETSLYIQEDHELLMDFAELDSWRGYKGVAIQLDTGAIIVLDRYGEYGILDEERFTVELN